MLKGVKLVDWDVGQGGWDWWLDGWECWLEEGQARYSLRCGWDGGREGRREEGPGKLAT